MLGWNRKNCYYIMLQWGKDEQEKFKLVIFDYFWGGMAKDWGKTGFRWLVGSNFRGKIKFPRPKSMILPYPTIC